MRDAGSATAGLDSTMGVEAVDGAVGVVVDAVVADLEGMKAACPGRDGEHEGAGRAIPTVDEDVVGCVSFDGECDAGEKIMIERVDVVVAGDLASEIPAVVGANIEKCIEAAVLRFDTHRLRHGTFEDKDGVTARGGGGLAGGTGGDVIDRSAAGGTATGLLEADANGIVASTGANASALAAGANPRETAFDIDRASARRRAERIVGAGGILAVAASVLIVVDAVVAVFDAGDGIATIRILAVDGTVTVVVVVIVTSFDTSAGAGTCGVGAVDAAVAVVVDAVATHLDAMRDLEASHVGAVGGPVAVVIEAIVASLGRHRVAGAWHRAQDECTGRAVPAVDIDKVVHARCRLELDARLQSLCDRDVVIARDLRIRIGASAGSDVEGGVERGSDGLHADDPRRFVRVREPKHCVPSRGELRSVRRAARPVVGTAETECLSPKLPEPDIDRLRAGPAEHRTTPTVDANRARAALEVEGTGSDHSARREVGTLRIGAVGAAVAIVVGAVGAVLDPARSVGRLTGPQGHFGAGVASIARPVAIAVGLVGIDEIGACVADITDVIGRIELASEPPIGVTRHIVPRAAAHEFDTVFIEARVVGLTTVPVRKPEWAPVDPFEIALARDVVESDPAHRTGPE